MNSLQNANLSNQNQEMNSERSQQLRNGPGSVVVEPMLNQVAQIIPFPLIGNTTNPLDWVEVFRDLVGQISRDRIGNNLPDCVQVDAQYGGFYLECKTPKRFIHYFSLKTSAQLERM